MRARGRPPRRRAAPRARAKPLAKPALPIGDDGVTQRDALPPALPRARSPTAPQVAQHEIVESKPDAPRYDLRMAAPFDGLSRFVASFDLDACSDLEHQHIPCARARRRARRRRARAPVAARAPPPPRADA